VSEKSAASRMQALRSVTVAPGALRQARMSRGARGWGWYLKFKREGDAGFKKNKPPTPFDWSQAPAAAR
jgi:hypothetical protein